MVIVLSIAGFDPSGGAGVLADIKTFAAFGCFGAAVITSLTFQNTTGVFGAEHQTGRVIRGQIDPLLDDYQIAGVKIGMLPTREAIDVVAEVIEKHSLKNIVVDPVMVSTSGHELVAGDVARHLSERLFPLANLITPNIPEAAALTSLEIDNVEEMAAAARKLQGICPAVLVKGGHLKDEAADVLVQDSGMRIFRTALVQTRNTHGTGCTLSSAIAALLACGSDLSTAVARAKAYVTRAIQSAPDLGHGAGPVNHCVRAF
jgi:hydroxymethylpyrimidine/phosphomethylpyrimidine kinase